MENFITVALRCRATRIMWFPLAICASWWEKGQRPTGARQRDSGPERLSQGQNGRKEGGECYFSWRLAVSVSMGINGPSPITDGRAQPWL